MKDVPTSKLKKAMKSDLPCQGINCKDCSFWGTRYTPKIIREAVKAELEKRGVRYGI